MSGHLKTAAVFGAGGKTGFECVKELVNKGYNVKAVVRSPDKYKDKFAELSSTSGASVNVVSGDVTDAATLPSVVGGCDGGVIFAASASSYFGAKSVDFEGVRNVATAISQAGDVGPIVFISSCLVTPSNRFHPLRILLNNMKWGLMDNKYKGEEALKGAGVHYTVVRPGGLVDKPRGVRKLIAAQGDKTSGMVPRPDVAAVCVAALSDPAATNVTLELVSEESSTPPTLEEQLKGLFGGLVKDA